MKEVSVKVNFSNFVYIKWCLKIIFEVMIIEEKLYIGMNWFIICN